MATTTQVKTGIIFKGHLIYVDGYHTPSEQGDNATEGTAASFEIKHIWCGDGEIFGFLVDIGYDCKEIEEVVIFKLKKQ